MSELLQFMLFGFSVICGIFAFLSAWIFRIQSILKENEKYVISMQKENEKNISNLLSDLNVIDKFVGKNCVTFDWFENIFKQDMVKEFDNIEIKIDKIEKDLGAISSYIKSEFGSNGSKGNMQLEIGHIQALMVKIEKAIIDNNIPYRVNVIEKKVDKLSDNRNINNNNEKS